MTPSIRYDFALRRRSLAALVVLCVAACAMIACVAAHRTRWSDQPADPARLREAEEKIDPNVATPASLRRLPGIGPELAARIVAFRDGGGPPFRAAEDLQQVKGIGQKKAAAVAPYLDFTPRP